MRYVRAAVDEPTARAVSSRGWWRGVLSRLRGAAIPLKAECVWLPVYIVTIPILERRAAADFQCSVDGLSGAFAIFAMPEAIVSGETPGEGFAPRLTAQEAERIARASLVTAMLRRRRKSPTAQLGESGPVELLRWPYWVFYHRRGESMDIDVIDAATGDRAGHKIKLGLLDAFRTAARGAATTEGK